MLYNFNLVNNPQEIHALQTKTIEVEESISQDAIEAVNHFHGELFGPKT